MVRWEIYTLAISPTNPPDFGANSMLKNVRLWLESPNCFLLKLARVTNLIPLWKWLANERFPKRNRTQNQRVTKSQHMQISWSLTAQFQAKSLYISHAVSNFYGTEIETAETFSIVSCSTRNTSPRDLCIMTLDVAARDLLETSSKPAAENFWQKYLAIRYVDCLTGQLIFRKLLILQWFTY